MQNQLQGSLARLPAAPVAAPGMELWRGAWVIFTKHMHKFLRNGQELGGTLAAPLLLTMTFGLGMEGLVNTSTIGGVNYLTFIAAGIIAFTALSGAVNAGMTVLEEKIRGILKEYLVAPIPRLSILAAATGSGFVKTLVQSLLILVVALFFGAQLQTSALGLMAAMLCFILFMVTCVGFANGMALRSKSIGGYHTMLFLLNLPLLFLSSAFYPLDTMPAWMRVIALLNPTTYVVEGLRVTLFGVAGLPLWLCILVLAFCAVICTWFGVRSFRKVA